MIRRRAIHLLCVVAWSNAAYAQTLQERPFEDRQRDPDLAVATRSHPELEPLEIRIGTIILDPSLELGVQYDSNIYALERQPVSDVIATIDAVLSARTDWSRHGLTADVALLRRQYVRRDTESTTDYQLNAGGRLDAERGHLDIAADTARHTQARSEVDAPGAAARPIRYQTTGIAAVGEYPFGPLTTRAGIDWHRYRFDDARTIDGTPLPQRFRDRDVVTGLVRADLTINPALALYVSATGNQRTYRPGSTGRDSAGYTIEAGADFDITRQVRGHVQAGYLSQRGTAGRWTARGVSGRGKVEWFAMPVLTLTVEGGRSVEDSSDTDAAAYLRSDIDLRADYELLRSLILSAEAGYTWDRFQGSDSRARRPRIAASAQYRMGRHLVYQLRYQHLAQHASGVIGLRRFHDDQIMLTVQLRR